MTDTWIKGLVIGQIVYLQRKETDNKLRLSPVMIDRLDEDGGVIFKRFRPNSLRFNREGKIISEDADQKIVPAPERTNFNDPDKIVDSE